MRPRHTTRTEEATQAYAIASKTLGGCAVAGSYIKSGHAVSGVGNEAVGVVVMVAEGSKSRAHSVVLNRTGRVMNVVDAAQPSQALAITAVAKALGQVNKVQCGPAGGECGGTPSAKDGPPPMGGDEPGFLAIGDLPPARAKVAPWIADSIELPKEEFKGSQCEISVNWATVSAKSKSSRVYLIPDSGKNFFGLNEIVLTTEGLQGRRQDGRQDQVRPYGLRRTVSSPQPSPSRRKSPALAPRTPRSQAGPRSCCRSRRRARPDIVSGSFRRDRR